MQATNDGIRDSVIDAIGQTPLVALERITSRLDGRILAKLETMNPGLSKKDRAARQILLEARECGALADGQPVVELTSGNMGTGLALCCAVLGHPFVAVMSRGNSTERARMIRAFGAEVILVDQLPESRPGQVTGGDLQRVEAVAERIAKERHAFRADQFELPGNANAHFAGTGAELYAQCAGQLDAFCDFAGSGGTFAGCARYLKMQRQDIRCYIVEPVGAEALAGRPVRCPLHPIQGGGYGRQTLPQLAGATVDGYLAVTHADAIEATRRLAKEEGIFAGYSSGANLAAALQLLAGAERGHTVAIVICDSGLKYLSTDLWP